MIERALKQYPFSVPIEFYLAPLALRDDLMRVHYQEYVDWIFSIAPTKGRIALDQDTHMNAYTLTAALRSAGAPMLAVDLLMEGKAQVAFCNSRPPGHHAERDKAMGFCYFNNVAVGIMHAFSKYGLKRIAVIDFDVHHGNGTQDIFQDDERVLLCSSFQHPFYPGYDAEFQHPQCLNVLLEAGTTSDAFREKVEAAWFDHLAAFSPELIFFSAGFDAHKNDPLADIQLTESDYVWLTAEISKIAHRIGCKMISVLEGGYNLDVLSQCVPAHINAMVV